MCIVGCIGKILTFSVVIYIRNDNIARAIYRIGIARLCHHISEVVSHKFSVFIHHEHPEVITLGKRGVDTVVDRRSCRYILRLSGKRSHINTYLHRHLLRFEVIVGGACRKCDSYK